MALFKSDKLKSKKGKKVIIRSATIADASAILQLAKSVIDEEIYQLTSASEFNLTVDDEEKWIKSHQDNPNHIILVAEIDSVIIGVLDFANGFRQRIAHTGEFGLSISKNHRDQGVGLLLLQSLIKWATQNETIEKIGLNVHSNNERAIALYKKMGFEVEGIRRKELKYADGHYLDTIYMALFVK